MESHPPDHPVDRELRRRQLAQRLTAHQARTGTIFLLTGLSRHQLACISQTPDEFAQGLGGDRAGACRGVQRGAGCAVVHGGLHFQTERSAAARGGGRATWRIERSGSWRAA